MVVLPVTVVRKIMVVWILSWRVFANEDCDELPRIHIGAFFANAFKGSGLYNIDSLPDPMVDGELTRVTILQQAYENQIKQRQFSLMGQLNMNGILILEIRKAESALWGLKSPFEMETIKTVDLSDLLFFVEADAKDAHQKALALQEKLSAKKSTILWLQCGDRNTKFFHMSAKAHQVRGVINELH
ncbi:hypothetical protein NE237_026382 [Protea cynaroides]|uniref:Uncharacterized protein n=1 Tax=Protea cynaroides TaxID=273540 RepID=A0A9Q0H3M9_9MAGN|nr:hypothetical protein NE237_026382 [Protea cynaroides]